MKGNAIQSPRLPITCGVSQGSILGPLFFIIYVNDLIPHFSINEVSITLYAYDTVLYVSHPDSYHVAKLLQEGLKKLTGWCAENKLIINVKKTKHMIISPSNDVQPLVKYPFNWIQSEVITT